MKKICIVLLIIILFVSCKTAKGAEEAFSEYGGAKWIYCRVDDNTVLSSHNANERSAPASLTKLLTASVALKYVDADEVFTVGTEPDLVPEGSSLCLISEGHRLKLRDLIAGMLMASGNDAAYTVAVSTARIVSGEALDDSEAVEYFCGLMNDFAADLGMNNSHFASPDGFDNNAQYTTAEDLLILARYVLDVSGIREIIGSFQKYVVFESGENITWTNTNQLLNPQSEFYSENAVGMKTGTTNKAGCCLIAAFTKSEKHYIAVILGAENDISRYSLALECFNGLL